MTPYLNKIQRPISKTYYYDARERESTKKLSAKFPLVDIITASMFSKIILSMVILFYFKRCMNRNRCSLKIHRQLIENAMNN